MNNTFKKEALESFSYSVFTAMGFSNANAELSAKNLVLADLRGIDSHGVARLSGYYKLWKKERLNAEPAIQLIHETPSTAVLDADKAIGLLSGYKAMNVAIEKAKNVGTGWVAVKNSNHFGIAAAHAMRALNHDMIGIAMTNASPLVAPTYSLERLLGTNPIAIAIPAGKENPFVADFSTTTAANGKLEILQRQEKEAPDGWLQSANGAKSNNADELRFGGALTPLGGDEERASHKGFCLGSWIDIFSGVLSGASYGPWAPPFVSFLDPIANQPGEGLGHFFGAMRIDAFRPADDFKSNMDKWINRFKSAKSVEGKQVIIPGEPEMEKYEYRSLNGIILHEKVVEDLNELAQETKVAFVQ